VTGVRPLPPAGLPRAVALALAAALAASGALACAVAPDARAVSTAIPAGPIDAALLDEAVRAAVNRERCRAGLPPLAPGGAALLRAAADHAAWMARSGRLSHRSSLPGRARPADRVRTAGVPARRVAENVGYVARYQIDNRRFLIHDAAACRFTTFDGRPLGAHSYASIAEFIVALWMDSPGHRRNLMARGVNRLATAAVFDAAGPYCGRVWFAQLIVG
jgi:uncharacterized protein YkwD